MVLLGCVHIKFRFNNFSGKRRPIAVFDLLDIFIGCHGLEPLHDFL